MKLLLENWRKYLDEIDKKPPIPGLDTPKGKQDSVDYFWFDHASNMEKEGKAEREQLENWGGFQVIRFNLKGPTPEFFYFLMDGESPKAYVAVETYEDGIKVGNVRKSGDAGFHMSELYKWLMDQHGALYSDTTQTPAGQKIWSYLQKDPDLNVVEYDAQGGMMWGWKATRK